MRLFHNRPFALLCFIFIVSALCAARIPFSARVVLAIAFAFCVLAVAAVLFVLKIKKKSKEKCYVRAVFCLLILIAALLAPLSRLVIVDAKQRAALENTGERYLSFVVISKEYDGYYSSEYLVNTESIDGAAKKYKCTVVCAFSDPFEVGDKIYAKAQISELGEELLGYERRGSEGEYIKAYIEDQSDFKLIEKDQINLPILLDRIKAGFSAYLERIFGKEDVGLAKGFLLGDKSGIGGEVIRDLRRSGVIHLLAVSGLHMAVIIGSFDLLLARLYVGKKLRAVILSVLAFSFLALTGFSMSACRSVVMLWMVYAAFIYVKENDPLTTLFSAVALIMLLSPSSVNDLGLWLSFLATLGLISVWQPISIRAATGNRSGALGKLKYIFKKILLSLLLTFICNAFICIVIWLAFGEISSVSLLSNLVLSPLSSLYMILVILSSVFGFLPIVAYVTSAFGDMIIAIARFFSEREAAVIPLTYDFVPPIIIAMSLALAVMLVIRLRRRWLVLLPPFAAVLAFCICFSAHMLLSIGKTGVVYYAKDNDEALVISNGVSSAVCDLSYGSYSFLSNVGTVMDSEHSTEISEIILTHYHARHPASLEKMIENSLVRKVYIPKPKSEDELASAYKIASVCQRLRAELLVYENSEELEILGGVVASVIREEKNGEEHGDIILLLNGEKDSVCYISSGTPESDIAELAKAAVNKSQTVVLGRHGGKTVESFSFEFDNAEEVLYSDSGLYTLSASDHKSASVYVSGSEKKKEYLYYRAVIE